MSKEEKPSKRLERTEKLAKLGSETVGILVKELGKGIENLQIEIVREKEGISFRISDDFADKIRIVDLDKKDIVEFLASLVFLGVDFVRKVKDENKLLTQSLEFPDRLEDSIRSVYDSFEKEGILKRISYRISCVAPTILISTLDSAVRLARLDTPINKPYPYVEISFFINHLGEEKAIMLEFDRNRLNALISKLSTLLDEINKLEETYK